MRISDWSSDVCSSDLDALAELGVVPRQAAKAIWEKGAFEVDRIDAIEAEVKHDVIAFLTNVAEHVGEPARFMHQGMTSSDVLDRSEEHTSELQSLMRISYAVFCLQKKSIRQNNNNIVS